jgi:hypothetical protein
MSDDDPLVIYLEPTPGARQWSQEDVYTGKMHYIGRIATRYVRADTVVCVRCSSPYEGGDRCMKCGSGFFMAGIKR